MRAFVRMEPVGEDDLYLLKVTPDQFLLLRNSLIALSDELEDADQRWMVHGDTSEALRAELLVDVGYVHVDDWDMDAVPRTLTLPLGDVRALHSLLTTLYSLVLSEREFARKTGFFRENVLEVVSGLRRGYSKMREQHGG